MHEPRRDFHQRLKYESSFMQARVRQPEKFCVALDVAIDQQVEIDCAWAILHLPRAAKRKLDAQQTRHRLFRSRQRISNLHNHVEIRRLFDVADWFGFVNGRHATHAQRGLHHSTQRQQKISRAVAEVRSQGDVSFGRVIAVREHRGGAMLH